MQDDHTHSLPTSLTLLVTLCATAAWAQDSESEFDPPPPPSAQPVPNAEPPRVVEPPPPPTAPTESWAPPPNSDSAPVPPSAPPVATVPAELPSRASSRLSLTADVTVPSEAGGFGLPRFGYGLSLGVQLMRGPVLLEPRLQGIVGQGPAASRFISFAGDVGASWMITDGPVTPVLGGGVGLRILESRGVRTVVTSGEVLQVTSRRQDYEVLAGPQAFVRTGVVFFPFFPKDPLTLLFLLEGSVTVLGDTRIPSAVNVRAGLAY